MKAALYARFSTENQSEASIEDQFRACERVAHANGFEIAARFEDRAISAGTGERPGYKSLLAAVAAHAVDVIITEDISRLWRNRSDFGQHSAEFEDAGIHLVTCVGDDTRRDGWSLVLSIKQAIAEHYRREVSYRTRRGLEGLAVSGKSTGGRCYGYRTTKGGPATIDPGEAVVVRGIFERAAGGRSVAAIASDLNTDTIPAPRGGRWNPSTVSAILRNERYAGAAIWGRTEARASARDSRLKTRIRRSAPLVSREDPALRIVSEELFNAAKCRTQTRVQPGVAQAECRAPKAV